jgi:antitoxin component YwqK of YwqJK toxin-antitoxin module
MKRPKSDIPQSATEVVLSEYHEGGFNKGLHIYFQVRECILDGQVVGQRSYDSDGNLMKETPLRNGKKHGREYIWDETGALESVEPYVDGKLHGLCKQYNRTGKVIGTYRFVHGTGYDIWRYEREDGSVGISEIFTIKDNALHGYEWWPRDDQHSVWHERHWQQGTVHGIERKWNEKGRLKRGYPKYWIRGKAVSKRAYMTAAARDLSLPKYKDKDNLPKRKFPEEIETLFER